LNGFEIHARTQSKVVHLRGKLHPLQLEESVDRSEDVV
jgi:hypothetical protein